MYSSNQLVHKQFYIILRLSLLQQFLKSTLVKISKTGLVHESSSPDLMDSGYSSDNF